MNAAFSQSVGRSRAAIHRCPWTSGSAACSALHPGRCLGSPVFDVMARGPGRIQDCVVTRSQLEQLGLSLSTAAQRCQRPRSLATSTPRDIVLHNGPLSLRRGVAAGAALFAGAGLHAHRCRSTAAARHPSTSRSASRPRPGARSTPADKQRIRPCVSAPSGFPCHTRSGKGSRLRRLTSGLRYARRHTEPRRRTCYRRRRRSNAGHHLTAALHRELRDGQMRGSRLLRSACARSAHGDPLRSRRQARDSSYVRSSRRLELMCWNPTITDSAGRSCSARTAGWMTLPLPGRSTRWSCTCPLRTTPRRWRGTTATAHGIVVVHHTPSDMLERSGEDAPRARGCRGRAESRLSSPKIERPTIAFGRARLAPGHWMNASLFQSYWNNEAFIR